MFAWYRLADLCVEHDIAFVLGHALYMKAIHGGKAKNDRIDAGKIARLLRSGSFPLAYAYPKGMRETRDLLRRRTSVVGSLMMGLVVSGALFTPYALLGSLGRFAGSRRGQFTDGDSVPTVDRHDRPRQV
jgi:hypothetical protein